MYFTHWKLEFHPLGTVGSSIWKRMDLRMTCRQSPVDIAAL
ncbi:hypothetical protein AAH079_21740 [Bacteroides thetaiotaomicron]